MLVDVASGLGKWLNSLSIDVCSTFAHLNEQSSATTRAWCPEEESKPEGEFDPALGVSVPDEA